MLFCFYTVVTLMNKNTYVLTILTEAIIPDIDQ
jgi:hypothetical protein